MLKVWVKHIANFYLSLFPGFNSYVIPLTLVGLFLLSYLIPSLFFFSQLLFFLFLIGLGIDIGTLYRISHPVEVERITPEKFSNGDKHIIAVTLLHHFPFQAKISVIDEIPEQFQVRDMNLELIAAPKQKMHLSYSLRPVQRGVYHFGSLHVMVNGPLRLIRRRISFPISSEVACYPSFLQLKQYQMLAISHRLNDIGIKNIRRLGHHAEFEQIKTYVKGDDFRTINWKATARAGKLMVNQYIDQRSQRVYCLIDKSRNMQAPDQGLTLLDYAINASLVMSYVALYRHDYCGLITFAEDIDTSVPATKRSTQMSVLLESLYKQTTQFLEADYEKLYAFTKHHITQRSLLLLFTNFDTFFSLERQLPYLKRLAQSHLLLVIFFNNTGLADIIHRPTQDVKEAYVKTIAEGMNWEKIHITKELEKHGIQSLLVDPSQLTVKLINQYISYKSRGLI